MIPVQRHLYACPMKYLKFNKRINHRDIPEYKENRLNEKNNKYLSFCAYHSNYS